MVSWGELSWVKKRRICIYMDVSENSGTPKSSILIGFSTINHPFWGTPIFANIHINSVQGCSRNLFGMELLEPLMDSGCTLKTQNDGACRSFCFKLSCLWFFTLSSYSSIAFRRSGEQQKPNNEETKRTKRIHDVSP